MEYNSLAVVINGYRNKTSLSVKECPQVDSGPEYVEPLQDDKYSLKLSRVNHLLIKYSPKMKRITPPKVVRMEPLNPIDCFLNISLTRRGFQKCKLEGKPFAKITQPLTRRVSFDVFEGLWKIKDSRLERQSRPKISRHILAKASKYFGIPLDSFYSKLLTRILRQYEVDRRKIPIQLGVNTFPVWRTSLREIMENLENVSTRFKDVTLMDLGSALTLGQVNVSNWHTPDVPVAKKSTKLRPFKADCKTSQTASNKKWHSVKEYVLFISDASWHLYCVK